ncbi:hypothetical protein [Fulvivirga sedimenti]|nr:hypothetical protein [Fulvivirga sedimenti]
MRRTFPPTSVIPAVLHEGPGYAGDIQGVGPGAYTGLPAGRQG